jgi:hypothetical protein
VVSPKVVIHKHYGVFDGPDTVCGGCRYKLSSPVKASRPEFFKHKPDLKQKQLGQEHEKHVPVPTGIGANFIMVHAEVALAFFETLFYRPTHQACAVQLRDRRVGRDV